MKRFKRVVLVTLTVLFFASVPFAMWYNTNYDRYGMIVEPPIPVFISVCTVEVGGAFNNTLRQRAAEYTRANLNVKLFIMPLSREQANGQSYPIIIMRENDALHSFVSDALPGYETEHCHRFLATLGDTVNNHW